MVYLHHRADGTTDHLQCDAGAGVFHSYDEEPRDVDREADRRAGDDDRDGDDEDQELARCVADAVCDAIKSFRKGDKRSARDEELEKRERNLDARERGRDAELGESRTQDRARRGGRDALADPSDHRKDFRSGDGRGRTADSRRGMAQDRARAIGKTMHGEDRSQFGHPAVDLNSIFPSTHPHGNSEGADINAIFGSGSRH
jgi:hypothetical protein